MGIGFTHWWDRITKRDRKEQQLDAELQFHFNEVVAANLHTGMSESEARRCARLEFGGLDQVKEECRDVWALRWSEDLLRDLRFAVRSLRKSPGFTITAILTLTLGIGANTAIFTVIHAVLLKPLEYRDPDRLVYFSAENLRQNVPDGPFTLIRLEEMRAAAHSFAGLGAFLGSTEDVTLSANGEPEQLKGARVSANFLDILGVQPIRGRGFRPEEDISGGTSVVMISESLWKSRFGGDPLIAGKPVTLNATSFEIAGVLSAGFEFPLTGVDVWMPRPSEWSQFPARYWRNVSMLSGFGRLRPNVTLDQARAEMDVLNEQYIHAHPEIETEKDAKIRVVLLKDRLVSNVRLLLWTLFGAAGFVLLIACANVASLLLARAISRTREFAERVALGAARIRLLRQLLIESLVLTTAGSILGAILASVSLRAITITDALSLVTRATPVYLPGSDKLQLNATVLAFTMGLSIATAILFGLFPSLRASRPDIAGALRGNGAEWAHESTGRKPMLGARARGLLVVGQVALSVTLLIGAALMIASVARLHHVDPGFQAANLLTMKIALPRARYDTDHKRASFFGTLVQRLDAVPGVRAAAMAMSLPTTRWTRTNITTVEGRPAPNPAEPSSFAVIQSVTPAYFQTLAIPLRRGRLFNARDNVEGSPPVMILNESLARRLWPDYPNGQDPVGQHISEGYDKSAGHMEIIGITADIHEGGPAYNVVPEFYVASVIHPPQSAYLVLRTQGDPLRFINAVRGEVLGLDRDQPISDVRTMDDVLAATLGQRRTTMVLLSLFAGVALLLSAIGIYGLIAYTVEQRTREIGIRMALGAVPSGLRNVVVVRAMRLALVGVLAGVLSSYGLTRFLGSFLYGVRPHDPATFVVTPAILLAVALVACWIPARRATRIKPSEALRCE